MIFGVIRYRSLYFSKAAFRWRGLLRLVLSSAIVDLLSTSAMSTPVDALIVLDKSLSV